MKTMPVLFSATLATFATLATVAGTAAGAAEPPAVGLLEQFGITAAPGGPVVARPTYVLTDRPLTAPTTFSGLQGGGTTASVICCYEVRDLTPLALAAELTRYGKDDFFVAHMKSVQGYRHIYRAEPTADRRRWTPLMRVLMDIRASPEDATPFSAAVVAARFDKDRVAPTFSVGGVRVRLDDFYRKKTDRLVYRFTLGDSTIEFSEHAEPH